MRLALAMRESPISTTKLVHLRLQQGIADLVVEPPHRDALVIVLAGARAVGQVRLDGAGLHAAADVREAVSQQLGDRIARVTVAGEVRLALGGPATAPQAPEVSIVVCTRSRPELLARCLESIAGLDVPATEVIVVDNAPGDPRTAALCEQRPVRYLAAGGAPLSALRTRGARASRGELVAFIDDDCIADPGWLSNLGQAFADPLCAAVVGYVGPIELAHAAQCWFEEHGGFEMSYESRLIDGASSSPVLDASPLGVGNVVFRRAALERVGGFDERIGPGTPSRAKEDAALFVRLLLCGQRVVFDPARVVWHRHRESRRALRRVLHDYACGDSAYATLCLLEHRQLDALKLWRWWWHTHLPDDLRRLRTGDRGALPWDCVLAEAVGTVRGPAAFLRARRRPSAGPPRASAPAAAAAAGAAAAASANVRVVAGAPPASVVVPSHDRRAQLLVVLDALARQTARTAMEVVVVLDGCRDGSGDAVRAIAWPFALKLVEQPAAGVAAARNRGASAASHDLLVLLDDDLVPTPGLVAAHAAAAVDGASSVTMGRHPPPASGDAPLAAMLGAWWEDHFRRKGQRGRPWSFLDLCSGNSSLSRTLLLDAGGFDERFTSRGEDYELGIRLLERGVTFRYLPSAVGEHRIETDLATAVTKTRAEGANDVLLARLHPQVFPRLRLSRILAPDTNAHPDADAVRLALSAPDVAETMLRRRMRAVRTLDRVGLRRRWLGEVGETLRIAFALGVRDQIGTSGALQDLLTAAATADGDVPARLNLGIGGGLEPLPSTGTSSLTVWHGGARLTQVRAVAGGEQWDADVIAQRVAVAVAAVAGPRVAATVLDGPRGGLTSPRALGTYVQPVAGARTAVRPGVLSESGHR